MGKPMRTILAITAVVIAVAFYRHHLSKAELDGWERFAEARDQGMAVAVLETARDGAAGTQARPWLDFKLALTLFEQGGPGDLERALQITGEALAQGADHPARPALQKLDAAIRSFLPQASAAGA